MLFIMTADTEPIRMTFATNIKKYRTALKYPQERLAEKCGLSVQTIKDIEGCRRWVSDNTLSKLAEALNVSAFQLLLPENYFVNNKKTPFISLISLKEKLKGIMDDQFENAIKSGDFS